MSTRASWMVAAALGLGGCAAPDPTGAFLGMLATNEARVGVALGETRVVVYFAGEGDTLADLSRWFEADVADDRSWAAEVDGWLLDGFEEEEGIFGSLTPPESGPIPYNASRPIDPDSVDGVYAVDGGSCTGAAIVFNSGFEAQGAYCPSAGEVVPIDDLVTDAQPATEVKTLIAQGADGPIELTPTPVDPG